MKAAAWKKLVRDYVLPYVPNAQLVGSILVIGDVDWVLHGVIVDTSAFSATAVELSALAVPLYVPGEGLRGDYREELLHPKSGGIGWDIEQGKEAAAAPLILEAVTRQAIPFFRRVPGPRDLAVYSETRYLNSINPPTIEVEAYSWILQGDIGRFTAAFERIERAVATMPPALTWGRVVLERARTVQRAVEDGPDAVEQLLQGWRADSVRRLKLDNLIARR